MVYARKDQATSSNIVHAMELHTFEPLQLVEDGVLALVSLGNDNFCSASPVAENRLKRVQHRTVRCPPKVNNR